MEEKKILAERHNNLYERIINILGNGAGRNGYGQGQGEGYGAAPESFPVSKLNDSDNNLVTAEAINAIFADLVRARIHQIGTEPSEIAEIIENSNIVAEETSFFVNAGPDGKLLEVQDENGTKKGILDFERLIKDIETDRFSIDLSQAILEGVISSTRERPWNGLIFHEVAVTFRNADHRRHFFNSGGEIRFSMSNSGSVTPKGQDWGFLCANLGTVKFNVDQTSADILPPPGANPIGNYDLTDTYQTILEYIGGGQFSGVYASNLIKIKAKENSDNIISFRIEFNDIHGGEYDENVTGRLVSTLQQYRAVSSAVTVPTPTYSTVTSIS